MITYGKWIQFGDGEFSSFGSTALVYHELKGGKCVGTIPLRENVFLVFVHFCLSPINPFQLSGECFWLICRFKTILLGLLGNPWIWIAFPLENTLAEDFFLFSIGNQQLKTPRSLSTLPSFFYCHKVCTVPANPRRSWGFFQLIIPLLHFFLPHQSKDFWNRFFFSLAAYIPLFFLLWLNQIFKRIIIKKNPQRTLLHPTTVMLSSPGGDKDVSESLRKGMS